MAACTNVQRLPGISDEDADLILKHIPTYPNWPKQGILFFDTTALLASPHVMKLVNQALSNRIIESGATHVLLPEARGYLFGIAAAVAAGLPAVIARKPNKLPGELESVEYGLEYGKDVLQIKKSSIPPGSRVYIIDDLLATGGTVKALSQLVERMGSKVCNAGFVVHLKDLPGAENLRDIQIDTVLSISEA